MSRYKGDDMLKGELSGCSTLGPSDDIIVNLVRLYQSQMEENIRLANELSKGFNIDQSYILERYIQIGIKERREGQ